MTSIVIPKARISLQQLSIVYRADRAQAEYKEMESIQQSKLDFVPGSSGLTFEGFVELCKNTIDVYEETEE